MCGISLTFSKSGQILYGMNEMLLNHRGKDEIIETAYKTARIRFNRLAITDRDTPQPGTHNGFHAFLNGEIYNYKELGFTGSECDVLAQGFDKYGCDFVKQLNGMFCIVAIHGEQVYIFRDRWGQKPLYYFENKDYIILSSEIKPILSHPEYRFSVNESVVEQWKVFNNVLTDETLFNGIYKMPKATYWHLNTNTKTQYWECDFTEQPMDYNEAKEEVRRLVIQAVKRMTPKEVAYGTCLSGGIDSNIISALMGKDVPTFSVGFTEGQDERHLIDLAKTRNYQIVYSGVRNLRECIYHLEDLRVGASFTNYGLFELASKFVKVIADGGGSDEIFTAYQWRYDNPDYYSVVNRTGRESEYCRELFKQVFPEDTLKARFKFDVDYFLEGVNIVTDRMSMSHTVECRQPFLDHDLADFAMTISFEYKKNKRILRDAFSDLLHPEVLAAPKMGFSSPDWFTDGNNKAERWANAALNEWLSIFAK